MYRQRPPRHQKMFWTQFFERTYIIFRKSTGNAIETQLALVALARWYNKGPNRAWRRGCKTFNEQKMAQDLAGPRHQTTEKKHIQKTHYCENAMTYWKRGGCSWKPSQQNTTRAPQQSGKQRRTGKWTLNPNPNLTSGPTYKPCQRSCAKMVTGVARIGSTWRPKNGPPGRLKTRSPGCLKT